jgi:hypothetical protein
VFPAVLNNDWFLQRSKHSTSNDRKKVVSFSNKIDRKVILKSEIKIKISVENSKYFQIGAEGFLLDLHR